ncbi:hypothetical protein BU14_0071s0071 [Porphyra umbilicalis]|uniref:Uncharacterized protein n=1 Tax=Porphyra umbilicalis TaxID=2786 RepID=A0A1X6PG33_PORUM|nr:hypothetical protein BU14_0071s0071 [Porphyra umbilicalis]|eukprot:OSX79817.1 hypothetical protein BU14_0071s0071 [Porphyra umbilicalis]
MHMAVSVGVARRSVLFRVERTGHARRRQRHVRPSRRLCPCPAWSGRGCAARGRKATVLHTLAV